MNLARKKLLIVGDSAFAEIACRYFERENKYQFVGFAVEKDYLKKDQLLGKPIYELEKIENLFPPNTVTLFVAITYAKLNRLRTRIYKDLKSKGYKFAKYISHYAYVDQETEIGENVFIFENNTVQPFVTIKNNTILWSGNHIGHHSIINENVFIASQVVISGFCHIGENSFLGVNSTISNGIKIGKNNFIREGTIISSDTKEDSIFSPAESLKSKVKASRFFRLK